MGGNRNESQHEEVLRGEALLDTFRKLLIGLRTKWKQLHNRHLILQLRDGALWDE